jgi:hypothetical protein
VIYNGDVLTLHHKRTNSNELGRFELDDYDFAPGMGSDGIVELPNGLRFGVEICQDHSQGALRAQAGTDLVDVHVVVAAGQPWRNDRCAARANGLGILCNMLQLSVHRIGTGEMTVTSPNFWLATV